MQDESMPPESLLNNAVFLSAEQVNSQLASSDNNPTMNTLRDCKAAMNGMPNGRRGIVLGSGSNTPKWIQLGWETLDINKASNPTYAADANNLSSILPEEGFDYIFAESLTRNLTAGKKIKIWEGTPQEDVEPAVGFKQLLDESKKVLKKGGVLIMDFVDYGHFSGLHEKPSAEEYMVLMVKNGFSPIAVIDDPKKYADPDRGMKGGARLMLYAKKAGTG